MTNWDDLQTQVKIGNHFKELLNGDYEIIFGQYKGKLLSDIAEQYPEYLKWIMRAKFPDAVYELVSGILEDVTAFIQGVRVS